MPASIPTIDVSPLLAGKSADDAQVEQVAAQIYQACSTWGFMYLTGHNVPNSLQHDFLRLSREFFALPSETKEKYHVRKGGYAWRGYMPRGGEGTHGKTDLKEGLYFGPEHSDDNPLAGLPLHGKNQFPDEIQEIRPVVLGYVDRVVQLGKALTEGISLSLGLERQFLVEKLLSPDPISIVRCFQYFPSEKDDTWGVGPHSDFGYLTILAEDSPGLQMRSPNGDWVDVPLVGGALLCNVGDMLDMLTGGRFISRFHRVLPPPAGTTRISIPYFFDFAWSAEIAPLPLSHLPELTKEQQDEAESRWKDTTFTGVSGSWSDYLGKKVQKIFPDLKLPDFKYNSKPSSRFMLAVPT